MNDQTIREAEARVICSGTQNDINMFCVVTVLELQALVSHEPWNIEIKDAATITANSRTRAHTKLVDDWRFVAIFASGLTGLIFGIVELFLR
jgi:hypothetical protein